MFTQGEEGIEPWAWLLEDSPGCEILHAPHLFYGAVRRLDQIRSKKLSGRATGKLQASPAKRKPRTARARIPWHGAQETRFTAQDLPDLPPSVCLAKTLAQQLGASQVLLAALRLGRPPKPPGAENRSAIVDLS